MGENTLYKLLEITGGITSRRWNMVQELVDAINKGHATVVEKHWSDKWKDERQNEYYPLKLEELSTWSTFDNTCIDILFKANEGKISCEVKIYDGDIFGGERKQQRFYAILSIKCNPFISKISALIENKIDDMADDAHDRYLADEKQKWIEEYKRNLL